MQYVVTIQRGLNEHFLVWLDLLEMLHSDLLQFGLGLGAVSTRSGPQVYLQFAA